MHASPTPASFGPHDGDVRLPLIPDPHSLCTTLHCARRRLSPPPARHARLRCSPPEDARLVRRGDDDARVFIARRRGLHVGKPRLSDARLIGHARPRRSSLRRAHRRRAHDGGARLPKSATLHVGASFDLTVLLHACRWLDLALRHAFDEAGGTGFTNRWFDPAHARTWGSGTTRPGGLAAMGRVPSAPGAPRGSLTRTGSFGRTGLAPGVRCRWSGLACGTRVRRGRRTR